jgi:hypothetical protein
MFELHLHQTRRALSLAHGAQNSFYSVELRADPRCTYSRAFVGEVGECGVQGGGRWQPVWGGVALVSQR